MVEINIIQAQRITLEYLVKLKPTNNNNGYKNTTTSIDLKALAKNTLRNRKEIKSKNLRKKEIL